MTNMEATQQATALSNAVSRRRFSFGLRHLLAFVAACALMLGAWNWLTAWSSVTLSGEHVKHANIIIFETNHSPTKLRLRIFGSLAGRATITDPWDKSTTVGPGNFDWSDSGDYYETKAGIRYSPSTVSSGTVTVQYKFVHFE